MEPKNVKTTDEVLTRKLSRPLRAALNDTPAVFIHGARQTGKTTLARSMIGRDFPAQYLTLDTPQVMAAASEDPDGFIMGLETPIVLDEVQLAPDLFRAIKAEIDRDRRPGRFLLTGSAHLLVLPRLAESLVGRMEVMRLWTLSQGEIAARGEPSIDRLFSSERLSSGDRPSVEAIELEDRVIRGGYPEILERDTAERREAWFASYVTTILQRDVRDLANIDGLLELPRLLRLLAARSATLLNVAEISRVSGIPQTTLKRYLGLLEAIFLVMRLPAWSSNLSKRLVRSPKILLNDTGLTGHLLGLDPAHLRQDPTRLGPVLENFVVLEVLKKIGWSSQRPRAFHFRTHSGQEIDLLLENAAGQLVGIEVKARGTVTAKDFRSLKSLRDQIGERFVRGVVFYTGSTALPFGDRMHALPVDWLWHPQTKTRE